MDVRLRKNTISCVFWSVAIFSYLFQCYYRKLAVLIVPCLALFLILEVWHMKLKAGRKWMILYGCFFLYLTGSFAISYIKEASIGSALRFYLILLAIPLAQCVVEPDFDKEWKIVKILTVIKSGTVLFIWTDVFLKQDYQAYRAWAQSTGAGDIYILNGIPRVQILGTSIFVTLFACELMKQQKLTLYGALMAITALAAGNSAYVLGMFAFAVFCCGPIFLKWVKNKNWKLIFIIPISVVVVIVFGIYSLKSMKVKAEFSNAVRMEQIQVLTNTNPLVGNGLGHHVRGGGVWRKYDGDTYFELQTLYIYNQIGAVGLGAFYVLTLIPYTGRTKRRKIICYLTYLIYTFFNPYCFDSTHIFAVLLITNCVKEDDPRIESTRMKG